MLVKNPRKNLEIFATGNPELEISLGYVSLYLVSAYVVKG
jgi:hypothetical protein